jgi:hypothetical protein
VGVFPSANEVVAQKPESEIVGLPLLKTRMRIAARTPRTTTTPALMARTIHPVRDFLRDPCGSVLFEVSAMMPRTRLGMPMTHVLKVVSADTMVKMIADVLLGFPVA